MKAVFNAFADPSKPEYSDYIFTFSDVAYHIKNRISFKTNMMSEMCNIWFENQEVVYIMDEFGKEHLPKELTCKHLRPEHNIYKIWRAGGFCSRDCSVRFKTQIE